MATRNDDIPRAAKNDVFLARENHSFRHASSIKRPGEAIRSLDTAAGPPANRCCRTRRATRSRWSLEFLPGEQQIRGSWHTAAGPLANRCCRARRKNRSRWSLESMPGEATLAQRRAALYQPPARRVKTDRTKAKNREIGSAGKCAKSRGPGERGGNKRIAAVACALAEADDLRHAVPGVLKKPNRRMVVPGVLPASGRVLRPRPALAMRRTHSRPKLDAGGAGLGEGGHVAGGVVGGIGPVGPDRNGDRSQLVGRVVPALLHQVGRAVAVGVFVEA